MEEEQEMSGEPNETPQGDVPLTPEGQGAVIMGSARDEAARARGDLGGEHGTPSEQLQRLQDAQRQAQLGLDPGGVLDVSSGDDYEFITDAQAESGVYNLVGGYVDRDGELHSEVEIRSMTGDEEDLLGNDSIPFVLRMDSIMSRVIKRFGTIVDPGGISQAVKGMCSGARTDLMIWMMVLSNWRTEHGWYDMAIKCGDKTCEKESTHKVCLLPWHPEKRPEGLKRYQPDDPSLTVHKRRLDDADVEVAWRVMNGQGDLILDHIANSPQKADYLTYIIAVRLLERDGRRCDLSTHDLLTPDLRNVRKKFTKDAAKLIKWIKALSVHDRGSLRADFLNLEPGVEDEIEYECPFCNYEGRTRLNVGQAGFFFPQETSIRSKRRSSI